MVYNTSMVEKLLFISSIIALVAFICMDLLNRIRALFDAKNTVIANKDAEIENLRAEVANLQAQLAQYAGVSEVSNFLAEQGF